MRLVESENRLQIWSPAKLNFFLEILGKRPDGYHEISTFMVPISLYDILELESQNDGEIRLWCDASDLSTGPDNLVIKAAKLLQEQTGTGLGANLSLYKRIPWQAGLGGGSSNAAATLLGLNQLWNLGLTKPTLQELAARLGSDVPFFLEEGAAWCSGRGEKTKKENFKVPYCALIVQPEFGLSTAGVYAQLTPGKNTPKTAPGAPGDFEDISAFLFNRLEEPAIALDSRLEGILHSMRNAGGEFVQLSGSGSAIFSLHSHPQQAIDCARNLLSDPSCTWIQRVFFASQDTTCAFQ